ncbi:MAG: FAD-binding oxidoreductase [Mycobacteriales bacterium]
MTQTMAVPPVEIDRLEAELDGSALTPGDAGYDAQIATFNLATRHQPALVVAAAGTTDVARVIRFAAAHDLPVGVQATGHGAVTAVDTGVLISTRAMSGVQVDPVARTATVGAGARWSEVIAASAPYGLAPLNGSSSDVGVVGYTLGGGLPILGRTFGFAADHVRSLTVVTADGVVRHCDASTETDLFWGLRGGKGNLGVVTELTIDLFPVATFYGGGIFWPGTAAPTVLHAYREWSAGLSDATSTSVTLLRLPPIPEIPEPLRGQFVVQLRVAHVGGGGPAMLEPMRSITPPLIDTVNDIPYAAVDSISQDPQHPVPVYERGGLIGDLTAEAVDGLLTVAGPGVTTPILMVELRHLGGALAGPPAVPNAVGGRDAAYSLFVLGLLMPQIAAFVPGAVDDLIAAMARHTTGGSLVNMHGAPGDATDRARPWPSSTYHRLRQLKQTYDPANRFRFGHAI